MIPIPCYIIEDEKLAIEKLIKYLNKVKGFRLDKSFNTVEGFLNELDSIDSGVLFIDVNLPGLSGLQLASMENIKSNHQIIFVTAYAEFAIHGFDLNAVDYLLKPYSFERFYHALEKAKSRFSKMNKSGNKIQLIKDGQRIHRIPIQQINYIEGYKEYIRWDTEEGKFLELNALKRAFEQLKFHRFIQIHKSYIVNLVKINSYDHSQVFVGQESLPIGRKYRMSALSALRATL